MCSDSGGSADSGRVTPHGRHAARHRRDTHTNFAAHRRDLRGRALHYQVLVKRPARERRGASAPRGSQFNAYADHFAVGETDPITDRQQMPICAAPSVEISVRVTRRKHIGNTADRGKGYPRPHMLCTAKYTTCIYNQYTTLRPPLCARVPAAPAARIHPRGV